MFVLRVRVCVCVKNSVYKGQALSSKRIYHIQFEVLCPELKCRICECNWKYAH